MSNTITSDQAGCWLDGHFGWHNSYRVAELAFEYGWNPEDRPDVERIIDVYKSRDVFGPADKYSDQEIDDACEQINDVVEEATDYLQSLAPAGYVFEWDCGELCLWRAEDEN
jgi:hypothetical protein